MFNIQKFILIILSQTTILDGLEAAIGSVEMFSAASASADSSSESSNAYNRDPNKHPTPTGKEDMRDIPRSDRQPPNSNQ